jgi:hypothetical protein
VAAAENQRLRDRIDQLVDRSDELREHHDALQQKYDRLVDHIMRLDRISAGLPEVPRPERPPTEPIPPKLLEYCNSFANPSIRKELRDTVLRRHHRGETWAAIQYDIMSQEQST